MCECVNKYAHALKTAKSPCRKKRHAIGVGVDKKKKRERMEDERGGWATGQN